VRMLEHSFEPEAGVRRVEVITGMGRRRRWSVDDKARIIAETLAPGAVTSEVARRHGMSPQQILAGDEKPSGALAHARPALRQWCWKRLRHGRRPPAGR
jgi:hypothetical protein